MKTADILTIIQETIDNVTGIKSPDTLKPWTMTQVKSKVKGLVGKFEDQLQHKHTYPSEFMQGLHRGEHGASITDSIVNEINMRECEAERMAFVAGLAQARGMVAEAMSPQDRLRGKMLDLTLSVYWKDSEKIGNLFLKEVHTNPTAFVDAVKLAMKDPFYADQLKDKAPLCASILKREQAEPSTKWSKTLQKVIGSNAVLFAFSACIVDAFMATLAKNTPPQSRTWDQRKTYGGNLNSRNVYGESTEDRTIMGYWDGLRGHGLKFRPDDAEGLAAPGPADHAVETLLADPFYMNQLGEFSDQDLRDGLRETGAWEDVELMDRKTNEGRALWLAGCDAHENGHTVEEDNGNLFGTPSLPSTPATPALPTKARPLYVIAKEIKKTWPNVNYGARPYLDAMTGLEKLSDMYMHDDARSIVLYFLSNANTWKGPDAKRIKAELKAMLSGKLKEAVSGCVMCNEQDTLEEAIYKGENVVLNQPKRTPNGPNKFVVYTKNDQGHIVKISFGAKKDYNCEQKAAKWTPRYWACKWTWGEKLLDKERAKDAKKSTKPQSSKKDTPVTDKDK